MHYNTHNNALRRSREGKCSWSPLPIMRRFISWIAKPAVRSRTSLFSSKPRGLKRTIRYGELKRETDRAVDLFTRFGIEPEQRVALLLLDQIEFPILFWGALKAGVQPVALNTLLSTEVYRDHPRRLPRPRALRLARTLSRQSRRSSPNCRI